jgi:hypothetical protein
VKASPPILGEVEGRKSFGGGKGCLQTQDGQASPGSTGSPADPEATFLTSSRAKGDKSSPLLPRFAPILASPINLTEQEHKKAILGFSTRSADAKKHQLPRIVQPSISKPLAAIQLPTTRMAILPIGSAIVPQTKRPMRIAQAKM